MTCGVLAEVTWRGPHEINAEMQLAPIQAAARASQASRPWQGTVMTRWDVYYVQCRQLWQLLVP